MTARRNFGRRRARKSARFYLFLDMHMQSGYNKLKRENKSAFWMMLSFIQKSDG